MSFELRKRVTCKASNVTTSDSITLAAAWIFIFVIMASSINDARSKITALLKCVQRWIYAKECRDIVFSEESGFCLYTVKKSKICRFRKGLFWNEPINLGNEKFHLQYNYFQIFNETKLFVNEILHFIIIFHSMPRIPVGFHFRKSN